MQSKYYIFKTKAVSLRKTGKTYGEIKRIIGKPIPKSTLSHWFKKITITNNIQEKLSKKIEKNIEKARKKAFITNRLKREKYIEEVRDRVRHLSIGLKNKDNAKIALAMLFWGEGSKIPRGCLMLGNSDPVFINSFLTLLRYCYDIDESKFRCTFQGRADQNIKQLEKFWSGITKIPLSQFYKARIDPRTIGKPTLKLDYKGVCRIEYFSGDIFMELKQIISVVSEGL